MNEDEEAFGMFWWYHMLEEEERKRKKRCPNCESWRIRYDEDREVWVCLDCKKEWRDYSEV